MKKSTFIILGLISLVVVLTSGVKSVNYNNGINGQTTTGCGGCHSGGQSGTVSLTGLASTVLPSTLYTFNLVYTPTAAQKYYGLDIKASKGTLAAGTGMKVLSSEVTHTAPFGSATAVASYTYTGIKWTSPASTSLGAVTFSFACVAGASTGTQSGTWQKGTFTTTVVLPVEFVGFNIASLGDNKISINWKTATEINTDHFEVEKSTDGRAFSMLTKVNASGNSQIVKTYSVTDLLNNTSDLFYYRIKSIDKDGAAQYSNVQTVSAKTKGTYVNNVYPNPAKIGQDLNVEVVTDKDQVASFTLINTQGKIVSSKEKSITQGLNRVGLKLSNFLTAGNYYMVVKVGNEPNKQINVSIVE
jgi:hypothetical protein